MEANHGNTGRSEIRISFRCARLSCQINTLRHSLVEVSPALWNHSFPRDGRDSHQQDAYAAAEWLRRSDRDGTLEQFFSPSLTEPERKVAEIEGWILGIA